MSIASEIARLQQAKADLKTAINAKGQSIADETIDEYADFVDAIEVGGGGAGSGDYLVRFIDYDGTILKEEYVDSGNAATAPTNPDHTADGLTFVEWNKTHSSIIHDLDVGATYETTDGKTHVYVDASFIVGESVTLYLNKSDASTLSVDWGDGSSIDTFTNSGNFNTGAHTYLTKNVFIIKLWISTGSGTYGFGNGSAVTYLTYGNETSVIKILVGDSVPLISSYGLYGMISLKYISLPNTITEVDTYAFNRCYKLEAAVIPSNGVALDDYAFSWCSSLKVVSLADDISDIDQYCFDNCRTLETIVWPENYNYLKKSCFSSCYSLKKIVFTEGMLSFFEDPFSACLSLEELTIPSTVKTIQGLIYGCYAIKTIHIPASVTTLSGNIFRGCSSLEEITFAEEINCVFGSAGSDKYMLYESHNVKTIEFPAGISVIGNTSLSGAKGLRKVVFKCEKVDLWDSAFNGDTHLQEVYFLNHTSVATLRSTNVFSGVPVTCKFYVPAALETAWKAATNWVTYAGQIVGV